MRYRLPIIIFPLLFFTINFLAQETNNTIEDTVIQPTDSIKNVERALDSIPQVVGPISYEKNKPYELGGITVTGLQKFSEEAVKVFSGLKVGQEIRLPGDKLTSAIKKLYEQKQFSTVDVYITKIDGNVVYLEFDVAELPQLNNLTFSGVKKSKAKELKKETELKMGTMLTDNLLVTTENYIRKKISRKRIFKYQSNLRY